MLFSPPSRSTSFSEDTQRRRPLPVPPPLALPTDPMGHNVSRHTVDPPQPKSSATAKFRRAFARKDPSPSTSQPLTTRTPRHPRNIIPSSLHVFGNRSNHHSSPSPSPPRNHSSSPPSSPEAGPPRARADHHHRGLMSPTISSALAFMRKEKDHEFVLVPPMSGSESESETEALPRSSTSDRDDWRKSDATVRTARPLQQVDSRPVSVAESVHTVVPNAVDNPAQRSVARRDSVERSFSAPASTGAPVITYSSSSTSEASAFAAAHKQRRGQATVWPPPVAQYTPPSRPSQSSTRSVQSSAARQPTISFSNGFAPAGLAKRAVEKMGRAWGGMGSGDQPKPPPWQRRTHDGESGAWSVISASEVDLLADETAQRSSGERGQFLGRQLRGPMGAGGVVFGRDLMSCAKATAVRRNHARRNLETRLVPAIVVRCAQHLLLWGVQEEGLFRVNGRPFHVSKLRAEFDTGADFDLAEATPGDLDPHAVASVFKAYLRELPEPILTRALIPFFEAAMTAENDSHTPTQSTSGAPRILRGPTLPSSVRNGLPKLRQPPSLTTLAMPSFSGMKPPSKSLLNALRSLIARLPTENRDMLWIVVELIKTTAKESRKTKMPLSNLLLVFYPSLNMNPTLLRVLCEREEIWSEEEMPSGDDDGDIVVWNPSGTSDEHDKTPKAAKAPEDKPGSEDVDSRTASDVDSASITDGASSFSGPSKSPSPVGGDVPRADALPRLSTSAESVLTPSTSSSEPSLPNIAIPDDGLFTKPDSSSNLALPLDSRTLERPPSVPKLRISSPISGPFPFPETTSETPVRPLPRSRSIPRISLPSFMNPARSGGTSDSPNALTPTRSTGFRKPSLHLLFPKPAVSYPSATSLISFSPYGQPLPPRPASDSSLSTPTSAFTARSNLPPVLDTPIDSSSIMLGLGIDDDVGGKVDDAEKKFDTIANSASSPRQAQLGSLTKLVIPNNPSKPRKTPIADFFLTPSSSLLSLALPLPSEAASGPVPPIPTPTLMQRPSTSANTTTTTTMTAMTIQPLRLRESIARDPPTAWTRSVLFAAAELDSERPAVRT